MYPTILCTAWWYVTSTEPTRGRWRLDSVYFVRSAAVCTKVKKKKKVCRMQLSSCWNRKETSTKLYKHIYQTPLHAAAIRSPWMWTKELKPRKAATIKHVNQIIYNLSTSTLNSHVVYVFSSGSDEQLHQSSHRVHPVENTERLAQVHQNKPGGEAKKLFPEAVLELRVDSERGDDPQLQGEDALLTFINVKKKQKSACFSADMTLPWCWRGWGKHRSLLTLVWSRVFSRHALEQQLVCSPPGVKYPCSSPLVSAPWPFSSAVGQNKTFTRVPSLQNTREMQAWWRLPWKCS